MSSSDHDHPLRGPSRRAPGRRWLRPLLLLLTLVLSLSMSGEALAQRAGPYMFNFKIGPAIGVSEAPTQFAMQLEFGLAVTRNGNGYLIFPLQLQFSNGEFVGHFPVGFQYEFPIRSVRGLYLYPRGYLGFSLDSIYGSCVNVDLGGRCIRRGNDSATGPGLVFAPGFGIKYIVRGRWNIYFEPFSLPIGVYFFDNATVTSVWYQISFGAGVNF